MTTLDVSGINIMATLVTQGIRVPFPPDCDRFFLEPYIGNLYVDKKVTVTAGDFVSQATAAAPTAEPTEAPTSTPEPTATPTAEPTETPTPTPAPTIGDVFTIDGLKYKITSASAVSFIGLNKAGSMATVTIPATVSTDRASYKVTEIAAKAMYKDNRVATLSIGKNVKTIGKNAFASCTKLTTVKGDAAVVTISDSAFSGCKALKTFPVMNKLQAIGASVFKGCVKLAKFTLGKAVKSIGKNAFNGCKGLKNIVVKTTKLTEKNVGAAAFKGIYKKATFKCPKTKLKAYKKLFIKKGAPKTCKFVAN